MPRVSILIATYNWSSVLPYSIGSALRQTYTEFEVLVIGDGCTDDSERVVAELNDPRIRWINLPTNSGHQSEPNNQGLRQARGEIVAYLGHDDLWLPRHLEVMVAALDRTGSDVAYSLVMLVDPGGSAWPLLPRPARGCFSAPLGTIHRRRLTEEIGGWRDYRELTVAPDLELWRRAQSRGYGFTFVPRLTGIKFPASWRRGVYGARPSHEQAAWLARIDAEPDLEAQLLATAVASDTVFNALSYRDLVGTCWYQTRRRIRNRLSSPRLRRSSAPGRMIDATRRFKGL